MALLLYAHGKATGDELAEKLDVNLRTVYRDISRLQNLGVPIKSIPGSRGGFTFDYQAVGASGLSIDHGFANLFERAGVQTPEPENAPGDEIVKVAETSLHRDDYLALLDARNRILVDNREWYTTEEKPPHFEDVRHAVFSNSRLILIYTERAESRLEQCPFDPYGIIWKGGVWYVFGQVPTTHRFIRIRLQRIVDITETGEQFDRDSDFDLLAAWDKELEDFGKGTTKVVIRIGLAAIPEFENFNWKRENKIEKHPDYWIAEMMVDRYEWLIPLALSYAGDVTILEPEALRSTIARAAERLADAHSSGRLQADSEEPTRVGDIRPRAMTRHNLDRP
ncbi:YafY family protein [Nocardia sp. BMG51109]|uniref:helix-turn-helix transcriptional regulator n=1 Tax=Nocardia sp. BMG51109 TaxID=1056816 RepID=UPI000463E63C|nr:transcriptional regulator [Nocardia sp. BMG51109]